MGIGFLLQDKLLKSSTALPNGAGSSTSAAIDLQSTATGDFVAECELLITAPALGVTPLPDAKTMKYDVLASDNSDLSSATVLGTALTQTGASGAGATGATGRFRLPSNVKRYVGVRATGSTTGDASASSFTTALAF